MLEKTMKQIFKNKINKCLGTITDKEVVKAIEKDLIITGRVDYKCRTDIKNSYASK